MTPPSAGEKDQEREREADSISFVLISLVKAGQRKAYYPLSLEKATAHK